MAEVVLENVTKVYEGAVEAVKDASLRVRDRELVVLVGPSGCGKSTTLRMIAGLETITEGAIEIGGRVVNDVQPKDRDIAMVFQNYALYPHMSVFDNMAFGLKLRKYPKREINERVREAARILGITQLLRRKPKALSGGERQRVAVGRAIVRKPAVFLFDEPLSNLDAKLRVEMRFELKRLHQRLQTTMIYVTHDQVEAMTLGERIVVMRDGIIHQVDHPLAVYEKPVNRFVAGFIGTPPMNFIEGELAGGPGRIDFVAGTIRITLPNSFSEAVGDYVGRGVVLGFRPEKLYPPGDPYFAKHPEGRLRATVNVVEPLGNEILVYFSADGRDFQGKLDAHCELTVGQDIEVACDTSQVHIFDRESGENVSLGTVTATA